MGVTDEADALSQVPHEVQVFLPGCIEEFQQDGAFGVSQFGAEHLVDTLQNFRAGLFGIEAAEGTGIQAQSQFGFDPVYECGGLGFAERSVFGGIAEDFCQFGIDDVG